MECEDSGEASETVDQEGQQIAARYLQVFAGVAKHSE
jgi:hypothetical protein